MTPLHLAASVGHHNIVTFFLEKFKVDVLSRGRVKYIFDHYALYNDSSGKRTPMKCCLESVKFRIFGYLVLINIDFDDFTSSFISFCLD